MFAWTCSNNIINLHALTIGSITAIILSIQLRELYWLSSNVFFLTTTGHELEKSCTDQYLWIDLDNQGPENAAKEPADYSKRWVIYLKVKPVVKERVTCCVIQAFVMLISSNYRRFIGGNALSRPVSLILVKECNHSTMGFPVLKPNKYPSTDVQNWGITFFIY